MIQENLASIETQLDPITLQVMTNAIYSVADEMVAASGPRRSWNTSPSGRYAASRANSTSECPS